MRKDAGLNGDLDRIPQLAWLLFLKAFDGLEQNREVTETAYRPAIEEPYRWRNWAADPNGPTGEALLAFVNGELLPYLRGLSGTGEPRPTRRARRRFQGDHNRMLSGYLLRDVVNQVNEIDFASSDDIHTMAHLYESMLREMRDAAGDSGEFYTPRPLIRFIVQQVDPKLGEIVLDPACGTGGFLVEALEHLATRGQDGEAAPRPPAQPAGHREEAAAVPAGHDEPPPARRRAAEHHPRQRPRASRSPRSASASGSTSILTNPPFGGEEEKSIQANFPADKQTAETAWLFLQLVIRQLKDGGRCGIVVPNGAAVRQRRRRTRSRSNC